jgi:hypothetical protein
MVTGAPATLGPVLTPHGRLVLSPVDDGPGLPPDVSRRIEEAFARGTGHGLESFALAAPPVTGAEYLTASVLNALWDALDTAFRSELAESKASRPYT